MVKKTLLVGICVSVLLWAGACGNDQTGPANEDEITIELANKTDQITIAFALFYGPGLDEWGEDMLDDEVIEPGEEVSFVLPQETYTVIPMTYDYYVLPAAREISEDYRLEIGVEGEHPILVTNDTETDIGRFYLSPTESEDWGEDWLGGEVIPAGISRFFFADPDTYDVLAIGIENETVLESYEIEVESEKHFVID